MVLPQRHCFAPAFIVSFDFVWDNPFGCRALDERNTAGFSRCALLVHQLGHQQILGFNPWPLSCDRRAPTLCEQRARASQHRRWREGEVISGWLLPSAWSSEEVAISACNTTPPTTFVPVGALWMQDDLSLSYLLANPRRSRIIRTSFSLLSQEKVLVV